MPEFFIFLLKINAALTLFCLAYYLILRKLTFYTLNRFFLLAGIVFSSLYPFVDPKVILGGNETLVAPITAALPMIYLNTVESNSFDYWLLAKVVFWLGVAFLACRTILRFYALYRVHQQSTPGTLKEARVRFLKGDKSTFSFWKNIYLNPALHQPEELQAILEHEQVHVKELHTIDILIAELTTIFYWFNPGVWYMKLAIQENVEFITDQKILQKGIDRKAYQYSMVHTLVNGTPATLMNHFNITAVKKRIVMMNSRRSSSFQLIRYVFLLPVLLLLTSAFTLYKSDLKIITTAKSLMNEVGASNSVKELQPQSQDTTRRSPLNSSQKKTVKPQKKQHLLASPVKEHPKETTTESPKESTKSVTMATMVINAKEQDTTKNTNLKGRVFRFSNGTFQEITEEPKKVIVLKGDKVNSFITLSQTTVNENGVKKASTPLNYYINDVPATTADFKSLDPAEIAAMEVYKNSTGAKADGLWIYTRSFKKLK